MVVKVRIMLIVIFWISNFVLKQWWSCSTLASILNLLQIPGYARSNSHYPKTTCDEPLEPLARPIAAVGLTANECVS